MRGVPYRKSEVTRQSRSQEAEISHTLQYNTKLERNMVFRSEGKRRNIIINLCNSKSCFRNSASLVIFFQINSDMCWWIWISYFLFSHSGNFLKNFHIRSEPFHENLCKRIHFLLVFRTQWLHLMAFSSCIGRGGKQILPIHSLHLFHNLLWWIWKPEGYRYIRCYLSINQKEILSLHREKYAVIQILNMFRLRCMD